MRVVSGVFMYAALCLGVVVVQIYFALCKSRVSGVDNPPELRPLHMSAMAAMKNWTPMLNI